MKPYDPKDKFTQPADGVVVIGCGPTDAEIDEAKQRIATGEDSAAVWADIDGRVAKRNRIRLGMEGGQ